MGVPQFGHRYGLRPRGVRGTEVRQRVREPLLVSRVHEGSINKAGRFQTQLVGLEAEVKDSRFPDGWGFFNFSQKGAITNTAEPLPLDAGCVECHTKNTAVERTFVQFYPTLMEVARKMGTVKPGF